MSLGRDGDVWKRADFSKVFLGRWHLLHRAEQGFVGSDRLTDGFFTLALVHISGEGGVSQAWRMCFECQSCLMSSLSYPQVALWVQTSAAEWAPALVRVVCIYHTCVFAVSIDRLEPLGLIQSFLFSASSSPDIYPARRCRMSRWRALNSIFKEAFHKKHPMLNSNMMKPSTPSLGERKHNAAYS